MMRFEAITKLGFCTAFLAIFAGTRAHSADVQQAATGDTADFAPGQGLRLKVRGGSLDEVLTKLSESAGFVIQLKPGVRLDGTVDVWSEQPLSKDDAVNLVKQVLADSGYTAVTNGRILTVMRSEEGRNYTAVRVGSKPEDIPRTPELVTQIFPVRNLNPVELARVLKALLPEGRTLVVDESANALILTDTQSSIRRIAEIISALDSVSSSANMLRVFQLEYGDAKSLAATIKELFTAPDSGSRNARGNGTFLRLPGLNLGRGSDGAGAPDAGQTPVSRVSAVADERGNFVIVSAPEALMPAVEKLVASVDVSVEDVNQFQSFTLKNADPQEMADLLKGLFPDPNGGADAGTTPFQFNGRGGRGVTAGGARQGTTANNTADTTSGRMQRLGRVLAVPDRRSSTLLVSAARTLMPEIADIIYGLDEINAGRQGVHVIELKYADPYEVLQIIQDLYPNGNNSVSGAGLGDALATRRQTMLNNQFTSGPGSGTGLNTGSSSRGTGNRGS
jgi:type II secretory pathway component GspD/PulD (secretin)